MNQKPSGKKILLVDVRPPEKFERDHVAGAVNIPSDRIEAELAARGDKDIRVALYCTHGGRAGRTCKLLHDLGYANAETWGGIEEARQKAAAEDIEGGEPPPPKA